MSWSSTNLTSTPPCDAAALTPKEFAKRQNRRFCCHPHPLYRMGRRRGCRASFHFLAAQRGILSGGEGLRWKKGCLFRPAEGGQGEKASSSCLVRQGSKVLVLAEWGSQYGSAF